MRIAYFTHSLASCWNHGNAHFLRGVLRELRALGHTVEAFEPAGGWSLANLLSDHGVAGLAAYRAAYPELGSMVYEDVDTVAERAAEGGAVLVHGWDGPEPVAALGRARCRRARCPLLFHDTHHRAVSDPSAIGRLPLDGYDGVLAFGAALAEIYRARGWGRRCF